MDRFECLCEKGNQLAETGKCREALSVFQKALSILPDYSENVDARVWVLAAIGDMLYSLNKWTDGIDALKKAYLYEPENAFINLRLGQCYYEASNLKKAREHLLQAYMAEGISIFDGEDSKYQQAIQDLI